MKTTNLAIEGMSCSHCVRQVSKALQSIPGVIIESVAVGGARIQVDDDDLLEAAVAAIGEAGYEATVAPDQSTASRRGGCCG